MAMRARIFLLGLCFLTGCAASSPAPPAEAERSNFDAEPVVLNAEPAVSEQALSAFRRSCASCHGYDAHGITAVGPDLRRAKRRTPDEWERYLRDPSGSHPAQQAAPLWITGDELKAIARYLDSLAEPRS
jgi:mono/diheme cytochrome c family protein